MNVTGLRTYLQMYNVYLMLTKIFIFIYARPRRGRTPVVRVGCQRSDKVYLDRRNYALP